MARTKFTFEKRQKELAKKQKKEEKAARRAEAKQGKDETEQPLAGEVPGNADGDAGLRTAVENAAPGDETPR